MGLELALLGDWVATIDGVPLPKSKPARREALLAYLACHPNEFVPRTKLDRLLFPALDPNARTNLRQTVKRLRNEIDHKLGVPIIESQKGVGDRFQFSAETGVDVIRVQTLLAGCEEHKRCESHCTTCMLQLRSANQLFRGPFLNDIAPDGSAEFELWVDEQRTFWVTAHIDILQRLARYDEQRGDYARAQTHVVQWLRLDPLNEFAHQLQMRLLTRLGRRPAALAHFAKFAVLLRENADAEPAVDTMQLVQKIRSMPAKPRTLNAGGDQFFGRQDELRRILDHLYQKPTQLLTIHGSGGVGKTSLANRVVDWLNNEPFDNPFGNDIYTISINDESATDAYLWTTLANELALTLHTHTRPVTQISRALQRTEALFIVHNGEFLDEAARLGLSKLLSQTPSLQMVVTSRKLLRLRHESILSLSGLPYAATPDRAQTLASTELLVSRARQMKGERPFDDEAWQAIARITEITEGHPLALTLIGSWLHMKQFGEVVADLEHNLDLLQTEQVDLPPRQRSIHVVFEQSLRLISAERQQLLMALTVFADSFDSDAAAAVAHATPYTISRLVDHALLECDTRERQTRYRLHPLLRQFLLERAAAEALQSCRLAHSHYFANLLHAQLPNLDGQDVKAAFALLDQTLDDLRLGWQTACTMRDLGAMRQYIGVLHAFFTVRGWTLLGRDWLQQAADLVEDSIVAEPPDTDEALAFWSRLFLHLGQFNLEIGSLRRAEAVLGIGESLAYQREDELDITLVHQLQGHLAMSQGQWQRSTVFSQRTLELAQGLDHAPQIANVAMRLGALEMEQRAFEKAHVYFQTSAQYYRSANTYWMLAHVLRWQGAVAFERVDWQAAQPYWDEAHTLASATDNALGLSLLLWQRGRAASRCGRLQQAAEALAQGYAHAMSLNEPQAKIRLLLSSAELGLRQQNEEAAHEQLQAAFDLVRQLEQPPHLLRLGIVTAQWLATGRFHRQAEQLAYDIAHHPVCSPQMQHDLGPLYPNRLEDGYTTTTGTIAHTIAQFL